MAKAQTVQKLDSLTPPVIKPTTTSNVNKISLEEKSPQPIQVSTNPNATQKPQPTPANKNTPTPTPKTYTKEELIQTFKKYKGRDPKTANDFEIAFMLKDTEDFQSQVDQFSSQSQ